MSIPDTQPVVPGLLRSGLYMRRDPSESDAALLAKGHSQWLPKIIKTRGDPITADMASPVKGAGLYGALSGLAGYKGGEFVGKKLQEQGKDVDAKKIAMYSGAITAILGALAASIYRTEKNMNIEDAFLRLPEGSTRRDVLLNPVLGAEEGNLEPAIRMAQINSALRGRYHSSR